MLILASQSPRRSELLAQAGYCFTVQASSISEDRRPGEEGISYVLRLAQEKASAVFAARRPATLSGNSTAENLSGQTKEKESGTGSGNPEAPLIVLGADTAVLIDGEVLGKPADPEDARKMLRRLSGRTHQVVTGVSVVAGRQLIEFVDSACELTHVTLLTLSEGEIAEYVAGGEVLDKAGAYAIQGYAARWIPRIRGCYFNVVGLPLALTASLLEGARSAVRTAAPATKPGGAP